MPPLVARRRGAGLQPPESPVVQTGHPLGAALVAGWLMREGWPRELVTGKPTIPTQGTTPVRRSGAGGAAINFATEGLYAWSTGGQNSRIANLQDRYTVAFRARVNTWGSGSRWAWYAASGGFRLGTAGTAAIRSEHESKWTQDFETGLAAGARVSIGHTFSVDTLRQYLDGRLVNTVGGLGNANTTSSNYQIGDNTGTGSQFSGDLEYLYLFNRTLLPTEMALLHADPYGFLNPQPLVWRLLADAAAAAAQDTPELYGRPFGQHGQSQMHQVLAQ